jgi:RNA polymerase sigma-70 factor (ECF subfamily)
VRSFRQGENLSNSIVFNEEYAVFNEETTMSLSQNDSPRFSLPEAVVLARAGDSEAFTWLFEHYNNGIYSFIRGIVSNDEDARDLTQQTFLRALERLLTLHDASKFKTWLYMIARNLGYDYLRAQRIRCQKSLEAIGEQNTLVSRSNPEKETAEAELLMLALAEVPERYRSCLLLRVVEGFSREEIAELLGIGQESVSTYVSIARERLRQAYIRLESAQNITVGKGDQLHEQSDGRSLP